MQRKPLALTMIVVLVVVAALSSGCRRSAAPPIEELPSEEEVNAAIHEAQSNTEISSSPVETPEPTNVAPPATPSSTPAPTVPPPPTPTATPVPVAIEPTVAPTEAPPTEPTPAAPSSTGTTYVVQPGDNLFRIGLRYGVTVDQLARANNITNPALIYVGQVLTIPAPTSSPAGGASPGTSTCSTVYIVKPGDNLFRIALRYGYSQYYLAQVNGIANPSLVYVGQQICIP